VKVRALRCVAAAVVLFGGCAPQPKESPPRTLVIATGTTPGVYYPLGDALARIYSARIPGVQAVAHASSGSAFNVDAVQDKKADIAFTQGDVAYSAFTQGSSADPRPHADLRAIAVLYTNAAQIVVRRGRERRAGGDPARASNSASWMIKCTVASRSQRARRFTSATRSASERWDELLFFMDLFIPWRFQAAEDGRAGARTVRTGF
jgi:hypothetical protein